MPTDTPLEVLRVTDLARVPWKFGGLRRHGTVRSRGGVPVREKREAGGVQQLESKTGQQQPVSTFVSCDGAIAIGSWRMVHWIDVLAKGEEGQLALSTISPTGRVQLSPHKRLLL